jgi:hypothetical protein
MSVTKFVTLTTAGDVAEGKPRLVAINIASIKSIGESSNGRWRRIDTVEAIHVKETFQEVMALIAASQEGSGILRSVAEIHTAVERTEADIERKAKNAQALASLKEVKLERRRRNELKMEIQAQKDLALMRKRAARAEREAEAGRIRNIEIARQVAAALAARL